MANKGFPRGCKLPPDLKAEVKRLATRGKGKGILYVCRELLSHRTEEYRRVCPWWNAMRK